MSGSGQRPPFKAKTRHSPIINRVSPKAQRNFPNQPSQGRARIDAAMTAQIAVCSSLICRSLSASTAAESCTCTMAKTSFCGLFSRVYSKGQCASRLRTSSADKPATRITLFRLVWPAAIVTEERGTFKRFAKNSMQASLALPSAGGAVRESFRASPTSPVMAFFFARGWTLTAKVAPLGESFIAAIERLYHRGHRGTRGNPTSFLAIPLCSSVPLWSTFFSLPEDRGPDAHAGCSLFDRDFEIVRHAHGEDSGADFGQFTRGNAVPNLAELAEIGPRSLRIFGVRRGGHQAANLQMVPSRRTPQNPFQ